MADRAPIPGEDGRWANDVASSRLPQPDGQQNPEVKQLPGPTAHRGRVRQSVWFFGSWNRFFPVTYFVQRFPGLLSAMQAVVRVRRRPGGQNGESLPARPAPSTTNPDPIMLLIVRLLAPSAVTDNRLTAAYRTTSRQPMQRKRGHPGSVLFSPSGSAIKRIKVGVKARPHQRPVKVRSGHRP